MRFGSVCSGIEAASVAWEPLGWKAAWFSEIEPFPSAVLAHHYPEVPNLGDMAALPERIRSGEVEAPDLFCGGTPCQAFSVAGLRQSLDDARGNLSLTFCNIADEIDTARSVRGLPPCIVFWENVPGVLNTKDNAFGCFLAELAGEGVPLQPAGGRWTNAGCVHGPSRSVAWRVTDAQYFGVAQRRRRVFVVASARAGFDPVSVLFEFDGLRRDTAPRREAGQAAARGAAEGAGGGGPAVGVCPTLRAGGNQTGGDRPPGTDVDTADSLIITMSSGQANAEVRTDGGATSLTCLHEAPIAAYPSNVHYAYYSHDYAHDRVLSADGVAPAQTVSHGSGNANVLAPVAFHPTQDPISSTDGTTHAMGCGSKGGTATVAVAVALRGRDGGATAELGDEVQNCLQASQGGGDKPHVLAAMQVRRLTPRECERLQGFPDDYTAIPWRKKPASECPDGPRYKALGNSWAVPNVRWIGTRIAAHLAANDNNPSLNQLTA